MARCNLRMVQNVPILKTLYDEAVTAEKFNRNRMKTSSGNYQENKSLN